MIRHLIDIYKKISIHPLTSNSRHAALSRYLSWQFHQYFNKSDKLVEGYNGIILKLNKNSPSINAQYYFGLSDYEAMFFLLHFLKPGYLFLDVGAHHGSYTLLAQHVGSTIIVFEPNPRAMKRLQSNMLYNLEDGNTQYRSKALGDHTGFVTMTEELGQKNHIVEEDVNALLVQISSLDDELSTLESPCLMKLDVEGYELQVLKGGIKLLDNPLVKAVIVEMMSLGERYGNSDTQVHEFLSLKGFIPYAYEPINRSLKPLSEIPKGNGLYLRDLEFVESQLISNNTNPSLNKPHS